MCRQVHRINCMGALGWGDDDRRRMLGTRTAVTRDWNEYFTLGIHRRAQPPLAARLEINERPLLYVYSIGTSAAAACFSRADRSRR